MGAQNGIGIVIAVRGEKPLVDQGEQGAVGDIQADEGIHGPVRIVGQGQLLGCFLLHKVLRVLPLHQEGVSRGDIFGLGLVFHAAAEHQGGNSQGQKPFRVFHGRTSLHWITAPWAPRFPRVARWDQKRSGLHMVQSVLTSRSTTPARFRAKRLISFKFT